MALDRISITSAAAAANAEAVNPDVSADGRYVVYESWATNLSTRDADGGRDIFLYDRQLDTVELISVVGNISGNGTSRNASVSADGRFVVFQSDADNIMAGDATAPGQPTGSDIFLYDRQTGTMQRVSASLTGGEGNGTSTAASISDDGRYVAFESTSSDLVAGDTNGVKDIFVWDRITQAVKRVSLDVNGNEVASASKDAQISGDGTSVIFTNSADLTGTDDSASDQDIFIVDHLTNAIVLVGDGGSNGVLSYDGQTAAFLSNNKLTAEPDGANAQVFVYDRATSTIELASISQDGQPADNIIEGAPAISGDGRYVSFATDSDNLAGHVTPEPELFLYDRTNKSVTALAVPATTAISGVPDRAPLSHDGSVIVFNSTTELVAGYDVAGADIFAMSHGTSNQAAVVSITPVLSSIAENASTITRVKVADVSVTDDGFGINTLSLSGRDASSFQLVGRELFLKAGVKLDYETLAELRVSVSVSDPEAASGPDQIRSFVLQVNDVNEKPAAVGISPATIVTELAEDQDTAAPVYLGDIAVTDDALGTNAVSISGADEAFFEIQGGALYLKSGVSLNHELKSRYTITLQVDDATVGSNPDASSVFTLDITDTAEAPVGLSLAGTAVREGRADDTTIGSLTASDPDVGDTLTFDLIDDAGGRFSIAGNELRVGNGFLLDYEQQTSHGIVVRVTDSTGLTYTKSFTINVLDVGAESVTGDSDANILTGGALADSFWGLAGNDSITGGAGNDMLDGGAGDDSLNGGSGNDTYAVDSAGDSIADAGGIDAVISSISWSLNTAALSTVIERLTLTGSAVTATGNGLANVLTGNGAANDIAGLAGDDVLSGLTGNDTLDGGTGNDVITGGMGRDVMTGGTGGDRFVFDFQSASGKAVSTRDVIKDFTHSNTRALCDRIDLSLIDANGSAAGNGAFTFLAADGAKFSGVKGQVRWYRSDAADNALDKTIIEADVNGDRLQDFQIELTGLKFLVASDFVL